MATHIGTLRPPRGAHKRRKRIGLGMGSGHGKTATRGSKGQGSRTGSGMRPGFEGGQMPLHRRLPKRGFTNIFRKSYVAVNLSDLERLGGVEKVTRETLLEAGIIRRAGDAVKILGEGELKAPLHVAAQAFSRSALEKIQRAGGKAEVVPL
jgi:large subunit ribosomal protein L15